MSAENRGTIATGVRLRDKTVAIGSGKGGVGKSTIAVNLALFYARQNVRVALVDLDPLSNIASILDMAEFVPEYSLSNLEAPHIRLEDVVQPIFAKIDLVLPHSKIGRGVGGIVRRLLFERFVAQLNERYDLLLLDLPAGINVKENLNLLPFISQMVVVVQPEPTSHVSAGGFVRAVLELSPDIRIYFWHNKFEFIPESGFSPHNPIGTYNRFVSDAELSIDPEQQKRCFNLAYVPKDAVLDLLQARSSLIAGVQHKIQGILQTLHEQYVSPIVANGQLPHKWGEFVRYYLCRNPQIGNPDRYTEGISTHLLHLGAAGLITGEGQLNDAQRAHIHRGVANMVSDPVYGRISHTFAALERAFDDSSRESAVYGSVARRSARLVEDRVIKLLLTIQRQPSLMKQGSIRHGAGILLFYLAQHKLMRSEKVVQLFRALLPVRTDRYGKRVRDRHRHIRFLIEGDTTYHQRYYRLIKILFPLLLQQISRIIVTFSLQRLLLRTSNGQPNREAYLKLLSKLTNDTINSGLGVMVGITVTPSYLALRRGALTLLAAVQSGHDSHGD